MKEIIAQYGSAVIAVLVAVAVFIAFAKLPYMKKVGVSDAMGGFMERDTGTILKKERITDVLGEGLKEAHFEVNYMGDSPIVAGEKTELFTKFRATDQQGTEVPLNVITILDEGGAVYHTQIQDGKEYLYLEQEGIYRIYLSAEKEKDWDEVVAISFPVQRGDT